jgi:hypothetical protein
MSTDIVAVAIGPDNKIYVTDELSLNAGLNTVDIFAASAAGGNVAPIAQIAGASASGISSQR